MSLGQVTISALLQMAAVLLQLTTAVLALRLIRVTGRRASWFLISAALCVMAVRRSISLWNLLAAGSGPVLLLDASAAMAISLLMLAGVAGITPLFQTIRRSEETLRQASKILEAQVAARTEELQQANVQLQEELEERHRAEAAAEAGRQRLYSLLDAIPALVYLKASDYTIRFANRIFRESYGAAEGRRCYELFGRTEICESCASLKVLETGVPFTEEWTRPDGARTYELHHYPFSDVDGAPLVLTLGMNITERKQMEGALRQSQVRLEEAQHLAHLGSWEWHVPTDETLWSQEMFHIFNLLPQPRGLGREEFFRYVHSDDMEMVKKAMADALSGERPYSLDFRIQLGDNSERFVHAEAKVNFDHAGQLLTMVGTLQDITARRQVEEQLRESEKNLRHLASQLLTAQEQERNRIARELHDELGQSLLLMKLQLRGIQKKALPRDQALGQECGEMLSHVDEILDNIRRLSRDLSPYLLEDLGLTVALRRLLREFSKHYHIKQHVEDLDELSHLFAPEAQVHIYRIFQETLTNIGKHSGASNLTVAIHRNDQMVSFLLQDDGVGFDVEQVLGGPATERGLGLAALEERVRILGGSLDLWSQNGRGTRIFFTVPVTGGEP